MDFTDLHLRSVDTSRGGWLYRKVAKAQRKIEHQKAQRNSLIE
jgi:hypothetical protein